MLDNLNANVYWKDMDGVYLGCNSSVVLLAKKSSKQDIIGKTDHNGNFPWSGQELGTFENDYKVLDSGMDVIEEVEEHNPYMCYLGKKSPLVGRDGKIIGVIGVSIDITKRKKLEKETKQQKIELEKKDELKKEFIRNFSHDVRLPINGIVGNLQLLQILAKDQPNLKKSCDSIDKGVMSLSKMFDHLYTTIMNEEFNDEIHNKDFDFQDMVDFEIALVKSSLGLNHNIKVSVDLDDKIPQQLHGDGFKVSQILRNILSNAVKYTEKGEIKLIAEVVEDRKDTIKIKFTISDTGSGVTPTDKNKIYEYGRRFVASYERNIPGTGIGLSIVKQHVNRLGGSIDFDSTIGKGTEFFVELTFKKV